VGSYKRFGDRWLERRLEGRWRGRHQGGFSQGRLRWNGSCLGGILGRGCYGGGFKRERYDKSVQDPGKW